jgi:tetratricopeptide (TPR) repeat protein
MVRASRLGLSLLVAGALLAGCAVGPPRKAEKTETPVAEIPEAEKPKEEKPADKGDVKARFSQALDLMKQKKAKEAEAAFVGITKDFPTYSGPWVNLGILYARSNRRNEAVTAFTRANELNPNNPAIPNWLGVTYREGGDYPKAQAAYEQAIKIKADYAPAHLNLGLLMEDYLKRPEDALPYYRRYQEIAGDKDLRVLIWIAEIEARRPKSAESTSESADKQKEAK